MPADAPEDAHGPIDPRMMLPFLGVAVLFAQEVGASGDDGIWRLGIGAAGLFIGAAAQHRWGTIPARKDKDDERAERIAAHEREREAYQVTTPVLTQITAMMPGVLEALKERRGS